MFTPTQNSINLTLICILFAVSIVTMSRKQQNPIKKSTCFELIHTNRELPMRILYHLGDLPYVQFLIVIAIELNVSLLKALRLYFVAFTEWRHNLDIVNLIPFPDVYSQIIRSRGWPLVVLCTSGDDLVDLSHVHNACERFFSLDRDQINELRYIRSRDIADGICVGPINREPNWRNVLPPTHFQRNLFFNREHTVFQVLTDGMLAIAANPWSENNVHNTIDAQRTLIMFENRPFLLETQINNFI